MPKSRINLYNGGNVSNVEFAAFDWTDFNEHALEELRKVLRRLGLYVYDDPRYWDTDMYGIILSRSPLTKSAIKKLTSE